MKGRSSFPKRNSDPALLLWNWLFGSLPHPPPFSYFPAKWDLKRGLLHSRDVCQMHLLPKRELPKGRTSKVFLFGNKKDLWQGRHKSPGEKEKGRLFLGKGFLPRLQNALSPSLPRGVSEPKSWKWWLEKRRGKPKNSEPEKNTQPCLNGAEIFSWMTWIDKREEEHLSAFESWPCIQSQKNSVEKCLLFSPPTFSPNQYSPLSPFFPEKTFFLQRKSLKPLFSLTAG